jgi:small subunit ribosomal protein S6
VRGLRRGIEGWYNATRRAEGGDLIGSPLSGLPAPVGEPHKTIGRRTPPIRDYEIMFIVDPALSDADVENIQERLRELAVSRGAEVKKIAVWERRRLAYPIKGRRDGIYILAELRANPSTVRELGQQLLVTENVLRHMVVRLDED